MAHQTLDLREVRPAGRWKLLRRPWFWAVIVLALILLTAATIIATRLISKPAESDVSSVTRKVNKHYILPNDETPALATVTDKSKVTTPFLKQAQNGDKILIYQRNQIAVIYRPSADRIVAVGPVTIDTPPGQPQP